MKQKTKSTDFREIFN